MPVQTSVPHAVQCCSPLCKSCCSCCANCCANCFAKCGAGCEKGCRNCCLTCCGVADNYTQNPNKKDSKVSCTGKLFALLSLFTGRALSYVVSFIHSYILKSMYITVTLMYLSFVALDSTLGRKQTLVT